MIINPMEKMLFKLLGSKQREFLKNKLTDKQKLFIKKFFFSGKWQRAEINQVKHRLYNLGFTKRGLEELKQLCNKKDEPYLNRLATWELALWYANQYSEDGAKNCLDLLRKALKDERDPVRIRQAAIMEAECYELLGQIEPAKKVISEALAIEKHPDLYLAAANLETEMSARITTINKALAMFGISEISLDETQSEQVPAYDCLMSSGTSPKGSETGENPKVTIIMPVFNAEDVIHTSIEAMLAQTWKNIEVLVVDDCSKDRTVEIVEEYTKKDQRVQLIKSPVNGGAYMARNQALQIATGDFVTINDADDWSHPEKLETQVRHLIENPHIQGNTSAQARSTNELKFYRRGKPGTYIFSNMSSFMFRREVVLEKLGFWHCVRFAADSEFIRRIKKVFGAKAIVEIPTGPLSFQRQTETSLTGNSAFGYHGFKMGVRREYEEAHDYFHVTSDNLYYDFPNQKPPFPVPEPMWPKREEKAAGYRTFDILYASEFRHEDVSTELVEITTLKNKGLQIGLVQLSQYDVSPERKINSQIRHLLNGDTVQMVVYGEKVDVETLIIRNPLSLQDWQKYIPTVNAKRVMVAVEKLPQQNVEVFLTKAKENVENFFESEVLWYPKDDSVREQLNEVQIIPVATTDWKLEAFISEKS